jgi:hypothetical protein
MVGNGGPEDGGLSSRIATGQAGGKAAPGGLKMHIDGRNADAMKMLMEGSGVEFVKHGLTLAQMTGGDATSSSGDTSGNNTANHGRGGGADAISSAPAPGPSKFQEDYAFQAAHRKDDKGHRGI